MHRVIAEKLRANPALLEIAHDNLDRWSLNGGGSQPYWDEWRQILRRPLEEVLVLLVEDSERMAALRHCGKPRPSRVSWIQANVGLSTNCSSLGTLVLHDLSAIG